MSAGFRAAATEAARIEPHTAVPRTPPSWIEVVWIPPATPASSSEMSPTMASVAEVTTNPMPRPNRTNGGQRWLYGESTCRVTKEKMASDEASRPKVMGSQGPNRLTSRAPIGPANAKVIVSGRSRRPAPTGLNPCTLCR